jgi:hypothetical protein
VITPSPIEKSAETGTDAESPAERPAPARVIVVGVDGIDKALDAIADGSLYGTVVNDSREQARALIDIAFFAAGRCGEPPASARSPAFDGKRYLANYKYVWEADDLR